MYGKKIIAGLAVLVAALVLTSAAAASEESPTYLPRSEAQYSILDEAEAGRLTFVHLSGGSLKADNAQNQNQFTLGNRLITRTFGTDGNQAFTTALQGRSTIQVASAEFEIVCQVGSREIVLNRNDTTPVGFTVSPSREKAELVWRAEDPNLEIHVFYRTDGERARIFKWLEVNNRGNPAVVILRATVESLEIAGGWQPQRGGVGQPVTLGGDFFFGIEHPAAANEARALDVVLSHFPHTEVAPGEGWKSQRAVAGAAVGGESLEEAFQHYLVDFTGPPPRFAPIFNDWGAHDELGTLAKPQLTEELTQELLDELQSMKSKHGTEFADYVLDAYWYDPQGAYLAFKKSSWPRGYEPALKRMQDLGMKPGLWFDLGATTLDLKNTIGWQGPNRPCLSDPEFRRLIERAVEFHVREHSLALLKFDFANMLCNHGDSEKPSLAVLEKNADALREICAKARQANPAMVILAFNNFSATPMMDSTKLYDQAYAVSPWWLLWFDALYSGDPRPSELPSVTSLRDSVNWYQDHVFRGFVRSWLPPFRIDDTGTIVGKTSTIYYLGAEGFTDSWILNIVRGAHSPTFYGDIRLLTESDRGFLAASLRFLRQYGPVLAHTRPILGVPGRGEVYGYFAHDDNLALVTVVNPSLLPQSFLIPASNLSSSRGFQKIIFSNDGQNGQEYRPLNGVMQGNLVPGEIRIYAIGPEEQLALLSLPSAPTRQFRTAIPITDPFARSREADLPISLDREGMTLAIVIQYLTHGEPDRSFNRPQEVIKVAGEVASKAVCFTTIPAEGTDIWSNGSWAVFKHRVERDEIGKTLHLKLDGEPPSGTDRTIQVIWLK